MIALVMIVLALQMTRDTKITRSYIYLRKTKTCLVKHFAVILIITLMTLNNVVKLTNKFNLFFLQHQACATGIKFFKTIFTDM